MSVDFVSRATEVWGDRWDYSDTVYTSMRDPVEIICKDHQVTFAQVAKKHLAGQVGCPLCGGRLTRDAVITKFKEVWGDRWDYSDLEFTTSKQNVTVRCRTHGEFSQLYTSHISGKVGCAPCRVKPPKVKKSRVIQTPVVNTPRRDHKKIRASSNLERCREVWGERWDYTNTDMTSQRNKVTVRCRIHGEFEQTLHKHIKGFIGCHECSKMRRRQPNIPANELQERATQTWGDRWVYSGDTFTGGIKSIGQFECPEHGKYHQYLENHIRGFVGCSSCTRTGSSRGEEELADFVEDISPIQRNVRGVIPGMELDVLVPTMNIALEFNGIYWHSEKFKDKNYHYSKYLACKERGIRLYQVWEDDWTYKNDIVKRHILQIMGASTEYKVSARDTVVTTIDYQTASKFLDSQHIQGSVRASVYLGTYHGEDLVAVTAFKSRGKDYELVRYATSCQVRGGHSKSVAFFERNYTYRRLITFADLTFGNGNLYRTTGWEEDSVIPPDYHYLIGGTRRHKFGFRKSSFKTNPNLQFEAGMSERELAQLNGLVRIYDAGKIKFFKTHP